MRRKGNFISRMYGFDSLSIFFLLICIILNLITFARPAGSIIELLNRAPSPDSNV